METKTVKAPKISCGHCVRTIKNELEEIEGVESVEGDPGPKTVTIQWRAPADWNKIAETMAEIGYPAEE